MRTIIIGGVAGGMSAATRLRRLDEERDIVVFERGSHVSFANCGLPYHVGGVIEERSALLLQTPRSLGARFRLDVQVRHEVVAIDRAAKTVTVRDVDAGLERVEPYDDLVLAVGARAMPDPVLSGAGVPVVTLRDLDDVDRIIATLETAGARGAVRAAVVGAGFIGLEAVENLRRRDVQVTLLQRGPQVLTPLDAEMAEPVRRELFRAGVDVRTSTTVVSATDGVLALSDGDRIHADLVVLAAGVVPETTLARQAGLELGPTGGIAVDGRHRTSDPSIRAVGDGVEKIDAVTGESTLVTMAGLANRHGRAVADDIAGLPVDDAAPALGTSILGLFDLTVGFVGWNERRLRAAGRAHRVVHTHPSSHAGYYPGAQQMAAKLLIDPTDERILGAQIVGRDGVDKRLDVIAVAMAAGLTASALSRLELAYAPQYGSAKDPVNLLGYVAENTGAGATPSVQWHELNALRDAGAVVVDVRSVRENEAGGIPGAILIPLGELRARHSELPDAPIIVHCQVGQRGHTATRLLAQLGYRVSNLDGGWLTWRDGTASATTSTPASTAARVGDELVSA